MTEPELTVIGVYRVPQMEEEPRCQLHQYYFFGNAVEDRSRHVHEYIRRCVPLVLIELQLDNLDERFAIDDFTQPAPEVPGKAWQVAYDEAVLSPDGLQVMARGIFCTRGLRSGRIAFYFHYYDPLKPMRWTYGEFVCPPLALVPERLFDLMPYSPVD